MTKCPQLPRASLARSPLYFWLASARPPLAMNKPALSGRGGSVVADETTRVKSTVLGSNVLRYCERMTGNIAPNDDGVTTDSAVDEVA